MTTATIPTVTLNNGVDMPVLGFGVFQIPPEQTEQTVADTLGGGRLERAALRPPITCRS